MTDIPPIRDIVWSSSASIEHEEIWYNLFQRHTFACKVVFTDDTVMVFVFPNGWAANHAEGDEASVGRVTEAIPAKFQAGWNKVVIL